MSLSEEEAALTDGEQQGPRVRKMNCGLSLGLFKMSSKSALSQIFSGITVQRNWWMENGWMDAHFGPWTQTHVCIVYSNVEELDFHSALTFPGRDLSENLQCKNGQNGNG